MAFPGDWNNNKHRITLNSGYIFADLTDFPLLLTDSCFFDACYDSSQTNGEDIRFSTDKEGLNRIPFEIVSWDIVNRVSEVWVKVPSILFGSNTNEIYVWYNNPAASAISESGAYGKFELWSDYPSTVHMGDLPGDTSKVEESGSSGIHLIKKAAENPKVTTDLAQIGKAQDFTNDYLTSSNDAAFNFGTTDSITFQIWVRTTNIDNAMQYIFQGISFAASSPPVVGYPYLALRTTEKKVCFIYGNITTPQHIAKLCTDWILDDNNWHMIHAVKNYSVAWSSGTIALYIDGGKTDSKIMYDVSDTFDLTLQEIVIGMRTDKRGNRWYGQLDEFRIRRSALTLGWIKTEYYNQLSPTQFSTPSLVIEEDVFVEPPLEYTPFSDVVPLLAEDEALTASRAAAEDRVGADVIRKGSELLDSIILNYPHNVVATNLDSVIPLLENLNLKMGDGYILPREDGEEPNFSSNYYIQNGMSYKAAIIALDHAARDLYNHLKSLTDQAQEETPIIVPDPEQSDIESLETFVSKNAVIIPPVLGTAKTTWYLLPQSVSTQATNVPPVIRNAGYTQLQIFNANFNSPHNLVGIHRTNHTIEIYYSFDAGITWTRMSEISATIVPPVWSGAYTNSAGGYRRGDGQLELNLGHSRGEINAETGAEFKWSRLPFPDQQHTHAIIRYGDKTTQVQIGAEFTNQNVPTSYNNAPMIRTNTSLKNVPVYNTVASTGWIASLSSSPLQFLRYQNLSLSPSRITTNGCVASFSPFTGFLTGRIIYTVNHASPFSEWAGTLDLNQATAIPVFYYDVQGTDIQYLDDGRILLVYGASLYAGGNTSIYKTVSSDNGDTWSVPEAIATAAGVHYSNPSLVQLTNGGLSLSFTTTEGQTGYAAWRPGTIKLVVSSDGGDTWRAKVTIFNCNRGLFDDGWLPTTQMLQLNNGQVFCFVETPVNLGGGARNPGAYHNVGAQLSRIRLRLEC